MWDHSLTPVPLSIPQSVAPVPCAPSLVPFIPTAFEVLSPLQRSKFCRSLEDSADLPRQRPDLLRRRRHVRERGLDARRTELDEVQPEIAERQTSAVELALGNLRLDLIK